MSHLCLVLSWLVVSCLVFCLFLAWLILACLGLAWLGCLLSFCLRLSLSGSNSYCKEVLRVCSCHYLCLRLMFTFYVFVFVLVLFLSNPVLACTALSPVLSCLVLFCFGRILSCFCLWVFCLAVFGLLNLTLLTPNPEPPFLDLGTKRKG